MMTTPLPRSQRAEQWRQRYGPWALVTGASDGIGREMARDLAARGLNLVLVARRRPLLTQLADDLTHTFGIQTLVIDADLSQPAALSSLIAAAEPLDIGLLVACAGFGTSGPLIDNPLGPELTMMDVNVRAVLTLTHHFARRLAARGRGGIVLMSSLVAFQGVARSANYAATKAYIQSLAEGLHLELAPRGVDVVASAPGPIRSGFGERANLQMRLAAGPASVARTTFAALGHRTTVRPGWLSKFLEGSLSVLPRSMRVRIMSMVMAGMTAHQESSKIETQHGSA